MKTTFFFLEILTFNLHISQYSLKLFNCTWRSSAESENTTVSFAYSNINNLRQISNSSSISLAMESIPLEFKSCKNRSRSFKYSNTPFLNGASSMNLNLIDYYCNHKNKNMEYKNYVILRKLTLGNTLLYC